MVALAKDKETYPGLTFKALLHRLVTQDGLRTITQISAVLKKSFPRTVDTPARAAKLPRKIASLLRKLHRGKLVVEVVERKNCPPPTEPITIKGVEFVPPKAKKVKEPKAPKPAKASKSASKGKTDKAHAPTKAELRESVKALTAKIKKVKAKAKAARSDDDGVEEVE